MKRYRVFACLLLAACSAEPPPPPIEVLAAAEVEARLAGDLDEFSAATGIPVSVAWGDSAEHADRLIEKSGGPVDVIITNNVADTWRAADRGALRPIESAVPEGQPAHLRDPENYWGALEVRPHAVYHHEGVTPIVASVHDLGTAGFAGRLCLSSSRLPVNRSLIAYLIEVNGALETERLVRRWVRNLAQAPFASEQALLEAVRDGACDYGIAGWDPRQTPTGMTAIPSEPATVDITAVSINRHAAHPESAQRLVDWLLKERAMTFPATVGQPPPAVTTAGWRDEEARLLAERAGYR